MNTEKSVAIYVKFFLPTVVVITLAKGNGQLIFLRLNDVKYTGKIVYLSGSLLHLPEYRHSQTYILIFYNSIVINYLYRF